VTGPIPGQALGNAIREKSHISGITVWELTPERLESELTMRATATPARTNQNYPVGFKFRDFNGITTAFRWDLNSVAGANIYGRFFMRARTF